MLTNVVSAINYVNFALFLIINAIIGIALYLGVKGKIKPVVQRIPAVDPIDEAIGRATETGRPILFSTGSVTRLSSDVGIQTMAGIDALTYVASRCARLGTKLLVTVGYAEAYPMHRDTVQTAYIAEGKGETFDPNSILYWGEGFGKMWAGIMTVVTDENPAAYINIGPVSNDVLQVAHLLGDIGCIAVGGTCRFWGLYTQVMSCDYVIVGEEIFAVAAYLNKSPVEASSIYGEDIAKLLLLALLVINILAGVAIKGGIL